MKDKLWEALLKEADEIDKPWLLAGDFNTYKSLDDKWGGSSNVMRKCAKFARWIDDCGLIDLGFTGPKFTWWKEVGGKPYMKVRLDRALANAEWRHLYPEASVRHLPRVYSDHCLILIDTNGSRPPPFASRPFRFQAAWFTHKELKDFFRENLSTSVVLMGKLLVILQLKYPNGINMYSVTYISGKKGSWPD